MFSLKALIVSRSENVCLRIKVILDDYGFRVKSAGGYRHAKSILRSHFFPEGVDVALIDLDGRTEAEVMQVRKLFTQLVSGLEKMQADYDARKSRREPAFVLMSRRPKVLSRFPPEPRVSKLHLPEITSPTLKSAVSAAMTQVVV